MDEREVREIEELETWDRDNPQVHPPSKSARAVVSVAFSREDFERVAKHAQMRGLKVSTFVREAVLDHIERENRPQAAVFTVSTGRGDYISGNFTTGAVGRADGPQRIAETASSG